MPIQRVPRYMLLLTDLLRFTPENHKDYLLLTNAIEEFKRVADQLNEGRRKAEAISKVFVIYKSLENYSDNLIIKGRVFIREGTLIEVSNKGKQCVYIFLFNNLMLLCKQIKHHKYKYIKTIPLSNLKVTTPASTEGIYYILLQQEEKGINILFETDVESEQTAWLTVIHKQIPT